MKRGAGFAGKCAVGAEELFHDLLYAPHLSILQADLDAVRVGRRAGQDILHDAFGELAGRLILLEDDQNGHAGFDVGADRAIHGLAGC